jgi:hypothetical protein
MAQQTRCSIGAEVARMHPNGPRPLGVHCTSDQIARVPGRSGGSSVRSIRQSLGWRSVGAAPARHDTAATIAVSSEQRQR